MLDIGWAEMALVAVVALIIIGPKDLPRIMRVAGRWAAKARSMAREFQSGLDDMVRESELDDVQKEVRSVSGYNPRHEIESSIDPTGEMKKSLDPNDPGKAAGDGGDAGDKAPTPASGAGDAAGTGGDGGAAEPAKAGDAPAKGDDKRADTDEAPSKADEAPPKTRASA